jgi:glycine C-acetyltransferase
MKKMPGGVTLPGCWRVMNKLAFAEQEIARLKEAGLYNQVRTIESAQGAWIRVDGEEVLNLCSNNYLGLANDEILRREAAKAIEQFGVGPAAVRSIAGTLALHAELERRLAAFKGCEAVLSVQGGLLANQAVIPPLAESPEDAIFTDELNHASIIDGCRLTKARRFIYSHNSPRDLREKLSLAGECRRRLIITDGVFSMDGDIAPLPEICDIADEFGALVMVDDAHGEGVLGKGGRGIVDHFHLHGRVDIEVGTLSKAFGVVGGFVAGSKVLIDYLTQKARPFLFSSAVPAADVAACIAAIDILENDESRVAKLWENAEYFKDSMKSAGFDLGESQTPICPVMLGDAQLAQDFSKALFEEKVFAKAIGFPTVPRGKARIRVMISATHSRGDLDYALEAFARVKRKLSVS